MTRHLSLAEVIHTDRPVTPTPATVRCIKSCPCGHVIEEWGRTALQAKKQAQAKLDLHEQEAHG